MTRKLWKCDFGGCDEIAQWYRVKKNDLVKLCTKHEAYLARQRWGKSIPESKLDERDIRYLQNKDRDIAEMGYFDIRERQQKDGKVKLEIKDLTTCEKRSIVLENFDFTKFSDFYFEKKRQIIKSGVKPSINEHLKELLEAIIP